MIGVYGDRQGETPAEPEPTVRSATADGLFGASGGRRTKAHLDSAGASPSQPLDRRKSLSGNSSVAGRSPKGNGVNGCGYGAQLMRYDNCRLSMLINPRF